MGDRKRRGAYACDDCGRAVSRRATHCPKCGAPTREERRALAFKVVAYVVVGALVLLYFGYPDRYFTPGDIDSSEANAAARAREADTRAVQRREAAQRRIQEREAARTTELASIPLESLVLPLTNQTKAMFGLPDPSRSRPEHSRGSIVAGSGQRCAFTQEYFPETRYFFGDLEDSPSAVMTFSSPTCASVIAEHRLRTIESINRAVTRQHSNQNVYVAFQTGLGDLRKGAGLQRRGFCIAATNRPITVAVAYFGNRRSITHVAHWSGVPNSCPDPG